MHFETFQVIHHHKLYFDDSEVELAQNKKKDSTE